MRGTGIELRDARVHYGPLEALHGITLSAPTTALTVLLAVDHFVVYGVDLGDVPALGSYRKVGKTDTYLR